MIFTYMKQMYTQFQQMCVMRTNANYMCGIHVRVCVREIHDAQRNVNAFVHMHVVVCNETFVHDVVVCVCVVHCASHVNA